MDNDDIVKKIREAKCYTDLPYRNITQNPFLTKACISYGIIAFAEDTNRWLCVRRRYSPEFINTIRGSYRRSDLSLIVNGYSLREISFIHELSSLEMIDERFFEIYNLVISSSSLQDYSYALKRFYENKEYILKLLSRKTLTKSRDRSTPEWLFPKGRLASPSESGFDCAIREFEEETGIKNIFLYGKLSSDEVLIESFVGPNLKTYETHYWIFRFDKEIPPPLINDLNVPGEIGERKWISTQEAENILPPHKYQILLNAHKLLSITINDNNWIEVKPRKRKKFS